MPIIHPYVGGAKGTPHGAPVGRQVVAQAKPPLTRQAYLDFQPRMSRRETYDGAAG